MGAWVYENNKRCLGKFNNRDDVGFFTLKKV